MSSLEDRILQCFEVYCCTCGVDKKPGPPGNDNPNTMCKDCKEEVANFCITCRKTLNGQGLTLCDICWNKLKNCLKVL